MPKGTRSKINRKSLASVAALAVASGKRSAQVDLKVEADNALKEGAAYLLPLDLIKPRPSQDIRPIDQDHVLSLMESIRILGLLQPIYVDKYYHLIAGAHRFTAYQRLYEEEGKVWGKIPVVVDTKIDASQDTERALLKEIAENEKRRNLTASQVQGAAHRLMDYDESFTRRPGRLRKGERALMPFLASSFGVSVRHLRSLMNQKSVENIEAQSNLNTVEALTTEALELNRQKVHKKMKRTLKKWSQEPTLQEDHKVKALIDALLHTIES
jgi:hypothetical protein